MSIYDEGDKVYLAALNKPMYERKLKEYEDRGYILIPQSHTVVGSSHKWRMNKSQEAITPEQDYKDLTPTNPQLLTPKPYIESKPDVVKEADFLPNWDKVEAMYDDDNKTVSKQKLRDYAATFGIKLNVRTTFEKMKKSFIESA